MNIRSVAFLVMALVPLAGRAEAASAISGGSCDRGLFTSQNIGTVLGAAAGGLLGSQFGGGSGKTVMTIAGVLGGGFLGNQIGASMDSADQNCMAQTLDHGRSGQAVAWKNPDKNATYRVTPEKVFYRDGKKCRNVTTRAIIAGESEPQTVTGIACRQTDGSWQFDNS